MASLGRGGMGEVYRAFDPTLRREVALKLLPTGKHSELDVARVLREARAAAALRHPNAVAVHDAGEALGQCYIVMELVHGSTLAVLASRGALPSSDVVRWLRQIALALSAAHEAGIVHRDVKPENIMVSTDGSVKLLDFGIAKATARAIADDGEAPPPSSAITSEGAVVGTPRYMAPEQLVGLPIDGRTDQFAWGLVAYELLVGLHPRFLLGKDAHPSREVLEERGQVMAEPVRRVVLRALALSAESRFPTMKDLVTAFDVAVAQPDPSDDVHEASAAPTLTGRYARRVTPDARLAVDAPGPKPVDKSARLAAATANPSRRLRLAVALLAGLVLVGAVFAYRGYRERARDASDGAAASGEGTSRGAAKDRAAATVTVCSATPDGSRTVAMGAAVGGPPFPALSLIRSGTSSYASTGLAGKRPNSVRVDRVDDGPTAERLEVELMGEAMGDRVLVTLEREPAIAWEVGGVLSARSLRGMSPFRSIRLTTEPRSPALLRAASDGADAVIVSLAKEGTGAAASLVPRVAWMSERCPNLAAQPRSTDDAGRPAPSGTRPEVAVADGVAYVAIERADMTVQITRFELTGGTDDHECALVERETISGVEQPNASLVVGESGALSVSYQTPHLVHATPVGAAGRLPRFGLPGQAPPSAARAGRDVVAAWLDTQKGRTNVRVGVVERGGAVSAALTFTGAHAAESVAVAGGRANVVVGWAEGADVRLETIHCEERAAP